MCADLAASAAFDEAVLAPLGGARVMDAGGGIGFGVGSDAVFWIGPRQTGRGLPGSPDIAFTAPDRAAVEGFFRAGVDRAWQALHAPRCGPSTTPTTSEPSSASRRQQRRSGLPHARVTPASSGGSSTVTAARASRPSRDRAPT